MIRWIPVLLIASAMAQNPKPEASPTEVIVLKEVPAAAFRWVGTGNEGVRCLGGQCEHYYHQEVPGFPSSDVVLRLRMPDERIAIVECYAKEVPGINYLLKHFNGDDLTDVPMRRVCATPPAGLATEAAFHDNAVRLTVPGAKKNGEPNTELYHLKGFLEPLGVASSGKAKPDEGVQAFVSTVPFGAQVYLDGERVGTSPVQVTIPSKGTAHQFTIKKDGYRAMQQDITADSEQTHFQFLLEATN
jgi:hypothetical protein